MGITLLCFVFVLLQLPFLGMGYGTDRDAWRVVSAARYIAEHGAYAASRFPGYPVPEYAYATLYALGISAPPVYNSVTVLMGLIAIAAFWSACRHLSLPNAGSAAAAFAFAPVMLVSANVTMDYMWALAFLMLALRAVVLNRPVEAGLWLGLATGCRITSAMMIVPFGLWTYNHKRGAFLPFAGTFALIGAACYLPVLSSYGLGFWRWYDYGAPQAATITLGKAVAAFGGIGSLSIPIAALWYRRRWRTADRVFVYMSVLAVALVAVMFIRLPHETEYLLPALPFLILLLWGVLPRRAVTVIAVCIAVSGAFALTTEQRTRAAWVPPDPLPHIEIQTW